MLAPLMALLLASAPDPQPPRPVPVLRCTFGREIPPPRAPAWEVPGTVVEVVEPGPLPEDPITEAREGFSRALVRALPRWRLARPPELSQPPRVPPFVVRHLGQVLPDPSPLGWWD